MQALTSAYGSLSASASASASASTSGALPPTSYFTALLAHSAQYPLVWSSGGGSSSGGSSGSGSGSGAAGEASSALPAPAPAPAHQCGIGLRMHLHPPTHSPERLRRSSCCAAPARAWQGPAGSCVFMCIGAYKLSWASPTHP